MFESLVFNKENLFKIFLIKLYQQMIIRVHFQTSKVIQNTYKIHHFFTEHFKM